MRSSFRIVRGSFILSLLFVLLVSISTLSQDCSRLPTPKYTDHGFAPEDGDYKLAVYYVVPTNVTYDAELLDTLVAATLEIQAWYQIISGGVTFELEYPEVVRTYYADQTREYYLNNGDWWGSLPGEMDANGHPIWEPGCVVLLFAHGSGWWAGGASSCGGDCGLAIIGCSGFPYFNNPDYSTGDCPGGTGVDAWPCTPHGAIAHELGHTFGLNHPADYPATEPVANHSVMQAHWHYPIYAPPAESPWGLLTPERNTLFDNPFMKDSIDLVQVHNNADIVNLPRNESPMQVEWDVSLPDGAGHPDDGYKILLDGNGYFYVGGRTEGVMNDFSLMKFETATGDTVWTRTYNHIANSSEEFCDMELDADGNIYVSLWMYISGGPADYVTLKYDSDGTLVWNRAYDGPTSGWDYPQDLAVGTDGHIYVTGWSNGDAYDYLTIKYTPDGDTVWTARYNNSATNRDEPRALAVDDAGNVYITGMCWRNATYDWITVKYNSSGDTLWTAVCDGPAHNTDEPKDIAVDDNGNVYVVGKLFVIGTAGSNYAFTTIKYNSSGVEQWANLFEGPWGTAEATQVLIDRTGCPVTTGNCYTGSYSEGGTGYDYCTIKYDPTTGDTLWTAHYSGPGNARDSVKHMTIDDDNNIYITGRSFGASSFGDDFCTVKYAPYGEEQWVVRSDSALHYTEIAYSVAVDDSGFVYVTGSSNWNQWTLKYGPWSGAPVYPDAQFGCTIDGLELTCTNSSSNATRYYWTFGDSTVSHEDSPSHTYLRGGTFTVRLRASDDDGNMDLFAEWITASGSCCTGPSVGNVDGSADNLVTMGDLTILINHLFISLTPLACIDEGNCDMSADKLVTMGDLTTMISSMFITLDPLPPCP